MKTIAIILLILLSSCGVKERVYEIDMELRNGKKIHRQYLLPDSIRIFIMERKKPRKSRRFLVYTTSSNDTIPTLLKTNVKTFKIN